MKKPLPEQGLALTETTINTTTRNKDMANEIKKQEGVFNVLNAVDCKEHLEKKNGLTYLSWAWAWAEVKKRYPNATYTIYESESGCFYHTDNRTCWVKTGVTIDGLEHIEYLPVMDYKNASIPVERVTSFDVNKAIQRSLTKACARHGLGLYVYAGEDLPEEAVQSAQEAQKPAKAVPVRKRGTTEAPMPEAAPKKTLTLELVNAGKCTKIVEYLSGADPHDYVAWQSRLALVKDKYICDADALQRIEVLAKNARVAKNNG